MRTTRPSTCLPAPAQRTWRAAASSSARRPGSIRPPSQRLEELTQSWAGAIEFVEETDAQLVQALRERQVDRVRYAAPDRASLEVLQAGNAANGCVVSVPVSAEGRLELLWYVREQSISTDYHRYGNLGIRADEERAAVM